MLRVTVYNGDADSIVEALDAIESAAAVVESDESKSVLSVVGNEGDARNVLAQFGYTEVEELC